MEIEGTDLTELNSLQDESYPVGIEKALGNILDPVVEQFKKALEEIQDKIAEGRKDDALELINQELAALDKKYTGCYLFPELAEFRSSLLAFKDVLSN